MESLAYTYWVLATEADSAGRLSDGLLSPRWAGATSLLAVAALLQSGGAFAQRPGGNIAEPLAADPTAFQLETITKLEKAELGAIATPPPATGEFEPLLAFTSETVEAETEATATSTFATPPPLEAPTPGENEPPDFRAWAEQRLAARAQARATEAEAAPRVSYRYYPRPYYSRARLPEEFKISPFNLVERAYQGGLKDSGIPGYGALLNAYKAGKIAPEDLVRAGIVQGRLTAADLYDQRYLTAVESQLKDLTRD